MTEENDMNSNQKLFQLRTLWTDENKKLNINIQKQGVSDQEALGILDMAKDQILNAMRERTVAEYSNK